MSYLFKLFTDFSLTRYVRVVFSHTPIARVLLSYILTDWHFQDGASNNPYACLNQTALFTTKPSFQSTNMSVLSGKSS